MRACGVWVVGSNLPFPYVRIIPHNRTEENQKKKKRKTTKWEIDMVDQSKTRDQSTILQL